LPPFAGQWRLGKGLKVSEKAASTACEARIDPLESPNPRGAAGRVFLVDHAESVFLVKGKVAAVGGFQKAGQSLLARPVYAMKEKG
jgi:hypothetical protein